MIEQNSKLTNRDLFYPFAVIIIMLSIFDLGANFAYSTILVTLILDFFQITSVDDVILINLFINLVAQASVILTFIFLNRSNKIEPEEKKVPSAPFLFIMLLIYSTQFVFIFILIPILDEILKPLGPSISSYESIFPTVSLLQNPLYYVLFFSVLTIGAAINEELIFRRSLIPFLERRGLGTFWVLIFTSVLFSFIHVPADIMQGSLRWTIVHFMGTFIGGFALGYLYMLTRNILWPMLLHAISNGFAGFSIIIYSRLELLNDFSLTPILLIWALVSLGVGVGTVIYALIMLITKRNEEQQPVWIKILKDINITPNYAKKLMFFALTVIIIKGIIPVALKQLFKFFESFITVTRQFVLLENAIEMAIQIPIIIGLLIIVFYKSNPLENGIWVSETDYSTHALKPSSPFPYSFSKGTQQFCGYCGKPIIPDAKFCVYCGEPHETEIQDEVEINEQEWD